MKKTEKGATHEGTLNRLARISGQVQGIRITQIQAVRSALRSVEMQILQKHMHHCVNASVASGSKSSADEKMEELLRVMKKQY